MNDIIGLIASLALLAAIAYLFGWLLWLRPLAWAWRHEQYGWVAVIMLSGWFGGCAWYAFGDPRISASIEATNTREKAT